MGKVVKENLIGESTNIAAFKVKVYEILNQNLLGYEELI